MYNTIALITVSVLFVISILIIKIQIKKVNKLEKIADNLLSNMESISKIIEDTNTILDDSSLTSAFENDDEVGIFFKEIKDIQDTLTNFKLDKNA